MSEDKCVINSAFNIVTMLICINYKPCCSSPRTGSRDQQDTRALAEIRSLPWDWGCRDEHHGPNQSPLHVEPFAHGLAAGFTPHSAKRITVRVGASCPGPPAQIPALGPAERVAGLTAPQPERLLQISSLSPHSTHRAGSSSSSPSPGFSQDCNGPSKD